MPRVEMASQSWGVVQDTKGNALAGRTVTIQNLDATAATTWSAVSGGTSSTAPLTTDNEGEIPGFIEVGTYTLTVGGVSHRVEAVAASFGGQILPFAASTVYAEGQAVTHGGTTYLAKDAFTSGGAFDIGDWDVLPVSGQAEITIGYGLPGEIVPQGPHWTTDGTRTLAAGMAYLCRWRPEISRSIISVSFVVNSAATSDDQVEIGLYTVDGTNLLTRVATSGAQSGLLNSAGRKTVALSYAADPAVTYAVALVCGTIGGTAAGLWARGVQVALGSQAFGTTWPYALAAVKSSASPLPASLPGGGSFAYTSITSYPALALLEV